MVAEFAAAIRERPRRRCTDGRAGLRVLAILEAASREPGRRRRLVAGRAGCGSAVSAVVSRAARRHGPGHRRRRHDRLDDRRPARRRAASPRSSCSTTSSAAGGPTSPTALAARPGRAGRGRHPRPRRWCTTLTRGMDLVFHLAAIRITQCAEEPRLALRCWSTAPSTCSRRRPRHGVRKVVAASSASVYGLAEEFPTTERHHPYNNDTFYGAAKVVQRGHAAQLPRHVRPGLRGAALLQRLRPADGRPRPLHRGADPLDGAHRRRASRR